MFEFMISAVTYLGTMLVRLQLSLRHQPDVGNLHDELRELVKSFFYSCRLAFDSVMSQVGLANPWSSIRGTACECAWEEQLLSSSQRLGFRNFPVLFQKAIGGLDLLRWLRIEEATKLVCCQYARIDKVQIGNRLTYDIPPAAPQRKSKSRQSELNCP